MSSPNNVDHEPLEEFLISDPVPAAGPLPGSAKKTRQHIVPQWLQRGFSQSKDPKRVKVAVYRKDSEPIFTNIVNVGVRKSFFTSTYFDGDKSVTQLDSEFAAIIDKLRGQEGSLTGEDEKKACRLFAHLEVRHHGIDRIVREMWANILPILFDHVRNEKELQDWIHKPVLSQQNCMDAIARNCAHQLRQAKACRGAPPVNLREMIRYAADYIDSFKALMSTDVAATGAVPELVAEKYAKLIDRKEVLEHSIVYNRSRGMFLHADAKSRVAGYSNYSWKIVHFPENIVLPDSMVFHEATDSSLIQNYLYVPARQLASYLPISSRSALVGRSKAHKRRLPNAAQMRHMAAQASFKYFIVAVQREAYGRLKSKIGKHRKYSTPAIWRLVVKECLAH
ncbi:MAG: DUF4238 domain-containing protein [Gammaproteobacteria bacterium]|nr:DUF4238 domain-containing protein [Gammaproteobacteria bacterium]